jgi:hypothetical protein
VVDDFAAHRAALQPHTDSLRKSHAIAFPVFPSDHILESDGGNDRHRRSVVAGHRQESRFLFASRKGLLDSQVHADAEEENLNLDGERGPAPDARGRTFVAELQVELDRDRNEAGRNRHSARSQSIESFGR